MFLNSKDYIKLPCPLTSSSSYGKLFIFPYFLIPYPQHPVSTLPRSPFSDGLNRCAAKTACAALGRHSPQQVRHGGAGGNLCRMGRVYDSATRMVWVFGRAEAVLSDGLSVGQASMPDIFQFAGARQSGMNARPTCFQTASAAANAPAPPEAARQTAAGLYYNPPLPYPRTQQCIL